ncbi:GIP, partial [Symbiodinium microadriaticum]
VTAYSDASFSPSGGRSIGCSLVTYNGNAVAWRSGRQSLVALSTAEAELIEAVASVQLQAGIAALTCEINDLPVRRALLVDNTASIGLCTDSPGTWRTRHLRVRAHALREGVREGYLSISHIPGLQQRADLGTKAFDAVRLYDLVAMWGLVSDSENEKPQPVSGVQAVLRVLVVLYCLTQPVAAKKTKPDLEVDFAWELYGLVFLLVVAGIALWEALKRNCMEWAWQRDLYGYILEFSVLGAVRTGTYLFE